MLTQDQKEQYVQYADECPYCESNDIESPSSENDHDGREMIAKVHCNSCGKKWKEVYTLTDIIEEE